MTTSFVGQRLRRLRLARGLSLEELASAMGGLVTKQALSKYELSKAQPLPRVLTLLAQTLSVKSSYFWGEPKYEIRSMGFRKKTELSLSRQEHFKNLVCHVLEERLRIQEFLGSAPEHCHLPPRPWKPKTLNDVEDAAESLRKMWGLGLDPIGNISYVMEDHCVHVVLVEAPEGFDGVSATATLQGKAIAGMAVATRREVPGERMRFNLAHELGHLFLKPAGGLDDEDAAHRFASAFLAPRETFFRIVGRTRRHVGLPELLVLKPYFGMSIQAIIHRLHDLDIISETDYKRWWPHLNQLGFRFHEPGELPIEQPRWLEQNVYRAFSEGVLSKEEAEKLLGREIAEEASLALLQKRNFMKLSVEERRKILAKQAETAVRHYNEDDEWRSLEGGDLLEDNPSPSQAG